MNDNRDALKKTNAKLGAEMTSLENEIQKLEKIIVGLTVAWAYKLGTYWHSFRFRFWYPCSIYGHSPEG